MENMLLLINMNEKVKASLFDEFFSSYLKPSFGSLPKKEIDLLIFELLLKHGCFGNGDDIQSISRKLKIPSSKVKALHYEVSLRNNKLDDTNWFKLHILKSLKSARLAESTKRVEFYVEDPLLRKELESFIRKSNGFSDYSFNRDILRIDFTSFANLIGHFADEREKETIIETIKQEFPKEIDLEKSIWEEVIRNFLTSIAKSAGNRIGEKTVDLTFGLLTSGISEIKDAIRAIIK